MNEDTVKPQDTGGKKISASFLYSATRSLFEQTGFSYDRPQGKNHCVMSKTCRRLRLRPEPHHFLRARRGLHLSGRSSEHCDNDLHAVATRVAIGDPARRPTGRVGDLGTPTLAMVSVMGPSMATECWSRKMACRTLGQASSTLHLSARLLGAGDGRFS